MADAMQALRRRAPAAIVVVMGVAGCGKSAGRRGAGRRRSAGRFVEGDRLHPAGKRRAHGGAACR